MAERVVGLLKVKAEKLSIDKALVGGLEFAGIVTKTLMLEDGCNDTL